MSSDRAIPRWMQISGALLALVISGAAVGNLVVVVGSGPERLRQVEADTKRMDDRVDRLEKSYEILQVRVDLVLAGTQRMEQKLDAVKELLVGLERRQSLSEQRLDRIEPR